MAEELSAKRHHGEMSDKSSNLNDIHAVSKNREYTETLAGVELHGRETMEIVCTSDPDKADEMMSRLKMKAGGLYPSFIGVDVEYTREEEPPQMAVVLQLCVEELCLVPKCLKEFLQEQKLYTFVGFSIKGDKEKLKMSSLGINPNKYLDMQRKWRVPCTRKKYDSLADVVVTVIHPFYKGMKKKIDREEDHKLWGISLLPDKLIEYAGIDAYAMYKYGR